MHAGTIGYSWLWPAHFMRDEPQLLDKVFPKTCELRMRLLLRDDKAINILSPSYLEARRRTRNLHGN